MSNSGVNVGGASRPGDDIVITPRKHKLNREYQSERWWVGGDPFGTAFFNAFSVAFPAGEVFFVETLRQYANIKDTKLRGEIRAFIRQEVAHSQEHDVLNKQLVNSGYDLSKLEEAIGKVLNKARSQSKLDQLTFTMCLEHFTAVYAHELVANPVYLQDADPEIRNLWMWHGAEEIEHKGVAFDTWLYATKDWSAWRRWRVRSKAMALLTLGFTKNRIKGMAELLRQDGIKGPRAWAKLTKYLFGNPGLFRRIAGPTLEFFKPGFHPWNIDDRHLIALAESEYQAAVMDDDAPAKDEFVERRKSPRLSQAA